MCDSRMMALPCFIGFLVRWKVEKRDMDALMMIMGHALRGNYLLRSLHMEWRSFGDE